MKTTLTQYTVEELFTGLYLDAFPAFARYVRSSGGNLDDARDAFQEALLIYYEKIEIGRYRLDTSPKAYILGISRNVYLKGRQKQPDLEPIENLEIGEIIYEEPAMEKLLLFLKVAGKKCMDILSSFYYEKMSMNNLSIRFGFRSERSATVQKYKCLEKVRDYVKERSLTYEDFIN